MIKITVTGSSSSGNNYIIESNGEILVLELGCSFSKILSSLKFDVGLKKVVGCVVSHCHKDHFNIKTAEAFKSYGFSIYGNGDVCNIFPYCTELKSHSTVKIGTFSINPFILEHSAVNFGYSIICPSGERIIFATDCSDIPYVFKDGADVFLVEANHDNETIEKCSLDGCDITSNFQSHMNVEDTIEFLKRNYNYKSKKVVLIHLSSRYSDEKEYIHMVKTKTPFTDVSVAHSGDVFNILDDFDYGEKHE